MNINPLARPSVKPSPQFSGLQLIQVHGDQSRFKDHYSLRFVDDTPADQVDLFNDKAWGNHSPGPNGTVIDNPTARYTSPEVAALSVKINRGEIPTQQKAKTVVYAAINQAPVSEEIKSKFKKALRGARFLVRLTHEIWDQARFFVIKGYYGPNGNLVDTYGSAQAKGRLPQTWSPSEFNRYPANSKQFEPPENKDSNRVAFETAPVFYEMQYTEAPNN
jgi:hypothetical protein